MRALLSQYQLSWLKNVFKKPLLPTQLNLLRSESTMRNILHVAEKNDAAKNIAAIMARGNSTRVRKLNLCLCYDMHIAGSERFTFLFKRFDSSVIVRIQQNVASIFMCYI
jgi:hypothetical protein